MSKNKKLLVEFFLILSTLNLRYGNSTVQEIETNVFYNNYRPVQAHFLLLTPESLRLHTRWNVAVILVPGDVRKLTWRMALKKGVYIF